MKTTLFSILFIFACFSMQNLSAQEAKSIQSPDKNLSITIQLDKDGMLSYSFNAFKQAAILNSPMGYSAENSVQCRPPVGYRKLRTTFGNLSLETCMGQTISCS